MPSSRVFPLSARQALEARVEGNARLLVDSRLLALEQALAQQLLPQRRAVFEQLTLEALSVVQHNTSRNLTDLRRHLAEQISELRGLRGKNSSKIQLMLNRVSAETAEFESCTTQLQAMRAVHTRMLKDLLVALSGEPLRGHVDAMIRSIRDSLLKLGAKRSFTQLFAELRRVLDETHKREQDIRDMLAASFTRLNTEFGFSLVLGQTTDLTRFRDDLALIERNYIQYLGLTQAMRLAQPRFLEQFRRMLMSRLRVVFESAASEIELWNRTASAQVDGQLRERRRAFKRRRESLERIQQASAELEVRLSELEQQDDRLARIEARLNTLFDGARTAATRRDIASAELSSPPPLRVAPESVPTLGIDQAFAGSVLASSHRAESVQDAGVPVQARPA
jgi:hypothetical protein